MRDTLENISPLDGRYGEKVDEMRPFFSEAALIKHRVLVETEWFIFLCNEAKLKGTRVWKPAELKQLRSLFESFDMVDAARVKAIEKLTNHDVKAVEYLIKEKLKGTAFEGYLEFVHFGCTSEDINNLAYAMMIKGGVDKLIPVVTGVTEKLYEKAVKYRKTAMMARTHGQPASPTTLGKELINVVARLERQVKRLKNWPILGKMNGAVGNYNAHLAAYPKEDWYELSKNFVRELGLEFNPYTTQIEPHDYVAEICDAIRRINTIVLDLDRDMWLYISIGYFKQKVKKGEVGSSTMPHKVNPIDFENSEGNLGVANAMLKHFSEKLPVSRWQRDLTDSTTFRNIGSAFAYSILAYKNCIQGLIKTEVNLAAIKDDLDANWELLAEPVQTVMRKYKVEGAYEKLKDLTRGRKMNKKILHKFIDGLKIPAAEKKNLKTLTPSKYTGMAVKLVEIYKPEFL